MLVPEMLERAAATYRERNKLYGNSYKDFGPLLMVLFPDGLHIETEEDANRVGVLVMMLSKVYRYCHNFRNGGHHDSLHDLSVYSMMLAELDMEAAVRRQQEKVTDQ